MPHALREDARHRYPTLDLLRVVAVTMTMLVHTPSISTKVWFIRPFGNGLWLGVDLFMLISGWLLGGKLLRASKRGSVRPWNFYARRWFRTLPAYYAMLVILYVTADAAAGFNPRPSLWVYIAHFLFIQQYLNVNRYFVSWSLCVEEHFYLLLPLLVIALGSRRRGGKLLAFVVAAEIVAIVCRYLTIGPGIGVPYVTHMRSDGLFIGVLFAWIASEYPALWEKIGKFAVYTVPIGVILTLLVCASIPDYNELSVPIWDHVFAPTVGTWALAILFIGSVHDRSFWSRISFPGLQYAGELTYAVYLVHAELPKSWTGSMTNTGAGVFDIAWRIALVIACSMALHHLVERPFLRLRDNVLGRNPKNADPLPGVPVATQEG